MSNIAKAHNLTQRVHLLSPHPCKEHSPLCWRWKDSCAQSVAGGHGGAEAACRCRGHPGSCGMKVRERYPPSKVGDGREERWGMASMGEISGLGWFS